MKVSSLAEVRHSPLSGDGAFATGNIMPGTIVHPLTGHIVSRDQLGDHSYDRAILQIDDDLFLEADGGADDYINHSCDPNLAFTPDGKAFFAIRPIAKGEELTFDYGTSEDDGEWKVPCLCKSRQCRGVITGFSALSRDVQMKLYPHCLPYLKRKYKSLLNINTQAA